MLKPVSKYVPLSTFVVTLLCAFLLITTHQCVFAQTSLLEKPVSGNYHNIKLKDVLADFSQKTGVRFSYSPRKIPVDATISLSFNQVPLQDALSSVCKNLPVEFERVDNYIVLKKGKIPEAAEPEISTEPIARKVTLSGYIKDGASGEFLPGATVFIPSLGMGIATNGYGFFALTLPEGKYTIELSFLGYNQGRQEVDLHINSKIDFSLQPQVKSIKEVVISNTYNGETVFKKHASQTELPPRYVASLPSFMGEPDVIKSMGQLPGISLYGDGSSYFHVRGGNYDQNLVLLDEATLFNPSHMLGLFTPIIPDAIQSVDIYKADYPVNFGGRLSSVVDIRTRDGNKSNFAASGDIGLISARGTIEGPIKKDASSYFVSYRKSYFDSYLKPSVPNLQGLYFYDFTAKVNLKLGAKDRLFVTLYSGKDILRYNDNAETNGLNWQNTSFTLRWNHVFGSRLFLNTTLLTSGYDYYLYTSVSQNTYWNSRITNAALKEEFSYFASPGFTWRFGIKWSSYGFNPGNYHTNSSTGNYQVSPVNSFEITLYGGAEHTVIDWCKLNYGLRLTSWMNLGKAFVVKYDAFHNPTGEVLQYNQNETFYKHGGLEPRISASFRTTSNSSLKLSFSRTYQYINLITNSISPFNSLEVWLPAGPNIKPQMADIGNVGYELSLGSFSFQSDLYYKKLYNQIGYKYHASMLVNPLVEGELRQGNGWSYGFETGVEKKEGKLAGRIGYTFSRAFLKIDDLNGNRSFPATFDRPHNFVLSLAWQAKPRWMLSANYNLASGMCVTTPTAFYEYNGYQVPVYTAQNNDRFPTYKRLDISTTFQLSKPQRKFQHSVSLSVLNFLNNRNPSFLYFNKFKDADGKLLVPVDKLNAKDLTASIRYTYGVIPSVSYHFNF